MIAQVASADALSVIGFFLTLVSLLGSFFYIHLGDWLREVIALDTKWRINTNGDDRYDAQLECRYEIEQIANWTTLVMSIVVTGFVVFIFYLGSQLWLAEPDKNIAWMYVGQAGPGFFIIYIVVIASLLSYGYCKARKLLKKAKNELGDI